MVIILLAIFGLLGLFIIYSQRLKKYSVVDRYPGPSSLEVAKFFLHAKSNADVYEYILSLIHKYGPVVKLWVKPFRPALVVADKSFIQAVLTSKEHLHKPDIYKQFIPILGDGLLSAQVNDWKSDRKLVSHTFKRKAITQHPLKFKNHVDELIEKLKLTQNKIIDIQRIVPRITLDIMFDILMGEYLSMHDSRGATFVGNIAKSLELFWQRVFSFYKNKEYLYKLTKDYKTWISSNANIHALVANFLNKQLELRRNKSAGKDFLDLLLDKDVPYERMVDHVKTFIITGYDTVGQGVNFTIYNLAKRPDVQEAIYNEYMSIVGKDQIPTFNDLQNMSYTECAIKESLRMYPVVPIIQRKLVEPLKIGDETIPPELDIFISLVSLQTSASSFEKPMEFNPDRFLPENLHKIEPHTYAPFSAGPRDCIGKKIAMLEMKFIIATIIKFFHIHPVPEYQLKLVGEAALVSKNGIPVIFKAR